MTTSQILATIIIIAAVTFLTRALPFLMFSDNKSEYISGVLPFAVIGMLVVYCLRSVTATGGIPEAIAIAVIVALHKWRHNLLLSIGVGTGLYMLLVQKVFIY